MKVYVPVLEILNSKEQIIFYDHLGCFKSYRCASEALLKKNLKVYCNYFLFKKECSINFYRYDNKNKEIYIGDILELEVE